MSKGRGLSSEAPLAARRRVDSRLAGQVLRLRTDGEGPGHNHKRQTRQRYDIQKGGRLRLGWTEPESGLGAQTASNYREYTQHEERLVTDMSGYYCRG